MFIEKDGPSTAGKFSNKNFQKVLLKLKKFLAFHEWKKYVLGYDKMVFKTCIELKKPSCLW